MYLYSFVKNVLKINDLRLYVSKTISACQLSVYTITYVYCILSHLLRGSKCLEIIRNCIQIVYCVQEFF